MPFAPARPCSAPSCPNLQPCEVHARKPFEATPRPRYGKSGWDWQRTVERVQKRDGYVCQLQLPGCRIASSTADHIVGRREALALGWTPEQADDDANLRAACKDCNDARAKEQARVGRMRGARGETATGSVASQARGVLQKSEAGQSREPRWAAHARSQNSAQNLGVLDGRG